MGWFEQATGQNSGDYDGDGSNRQNRDQYRANKEAMGGRTINQRNLDEAARVGALGRDSSGRTVRDSSAYDRASESSNSASGGRITPADKRREGTYLDMILNQAFGAPPVPMPAGMRPGGKVAPVPAGRPSWYGNPATIQQMQQVQQGLNNGLSLEAIIGGALGGGAAVLAYEMWKANNAGGSAFQPNGKGGAGLGGGVGPTGPNTRPSGPGTNITSPRPRIVDGVPFETDIIDATFEELYNSGQLGYEPRLRTNEQGITEEVKMLPTYNLRDDGIGYSGGTPKEPLRLPPPGPARMEPSVGAGGEPNNSSINSSIDATMIEPHSERYYNEFGGYLKSQGITDPGQIGITPSNAPQLWEGLTKAMQGL